MPEPLARIAFTSCAHHGRTEQPAWNWIAARQHDLLILLGDNIYAKNSGWHLADLARKYAVRMANPEFRNVIDTIPTIATWDDHDLGPNNALGDTIEACTPGVTGFERRQEARLLFLSHLSPRGVKSDALQQPKGEIYCSYVLNGVLIIVLDARYYRQDIREAGAEAQFLGIKQEAWLWSELERAKSGNYIATVVCCGSTIHSNNQLGEDVFHYRRFYDEFAKRFRDCPNPIFLSGDIHKSKFVRHDGFVEGIASGVAQRRDATTSEEFPDGYEDINNWGELHIFEDCARFEFLGTDLRVVEEQFPITGLNEA